MEWRVCYNFPNYEVSEYGDVRRADTKRLRTPVLTSAGYPAVGLCRDGKTTTVTIHSLVAAEFLGDRPFGGAEICHKDSNKSNSHYTNLRWDTHRANMADSALGEKNLQAKLTSDQVIEIRRLHASGRKQASIAKQFNMAHSSISKIVNRKKWAHIS